MFHHFFSERERDKFQFMVGLNILCAFEWCVLSIQKHFLGFMSIYFSELAKRPFKSTADEGKKPLMHICNKLKASLFHDSRVLFLLLCSVPFLFHGQTYFSTLKFEESLSEKALVPYGTLSNLEQPLWTGPNSARKGPVFLLSEYVDTNQIGTQLDLFFSFQCT